MVKDVMGNPQCTIILGIDTSLRSSGVAVVENEGSKLAALSWGTIKNKPSVRHSVCMAHIVESVGGHDRKVSARGRGDGGHLFL